MHSHVLPFPTAAAEGSVTRGHLCVAATAHSGRKPLVSLLRGVILMPGGLSNTELSSAVGTSAKAAGTTSDPCAKAIRFRRSEKVQVGTETFLMVGACTRILFPVESAAVCLSSYPEILMENPTGSFHPFTYFPKLTGTQKLL